ncbi:MAG: ABC transporter substrate-binding protein [[Clostridium] scindens]
MDDQYVTLSKFDDYWQGWKENQIDVVQTLIVKDNATQIQMLNSGEVDKLQIPLTENLDMLEKNPKIQILKGGSLQTNIFTFNMQKAPFDNPKVRQAVSYAFDYEGVKNNVYNGQATVPSGFMPANFAEHNENIPEQKQDIEKAKQLMKESGVGSCEIRYIFAKEATTRFRWHKFFRQI